MTQTGHNCAGIESTRDRATIHCCALKPDTSLWGNLLAAQRRLTKKPSSSKNLAWAVGGGRGIRTLDTAQHRIHTFQACAFNRSATPPRRDGGGPRSRRGGKLHESPRPCKPGNCHCGRPRPLFFKNKGGLGHRPSRVRAGARGNAKLSRASAPPPTHGKSCR